MITPAYSPTATERVLPRLALDFTTASLDPRVTVTRALNTATAINSFGFIAIVNADLPRFDYDPVALTPKGLLIEESRINLATRSAEFNDATWVKTNATVTANAIVSPDGTQNADKLVETVATGNHEISKNAATSIGSAYTHTVYAKKGERDYIFIYMFDTTTVSAYFNIATGAVVSTNNVTATITNAGNGFYRCSITRTVTATNTFFGYRISTNGTSTSYTGDGTSGIYLYGAQLEAGAFATSYIPTTTTSLTRNADDVTMTGTNFTSWYNASEGALSLKYLKSTTQVSGRYVARFFSPTVGAGVSYWINANGIDTRYWIGATNASLGNGSLVNVNTGAFAYKTATSTGALNAAANVGNGGTVPLDVTELRIGDAGGINAHIQRILYWPFALTAAEIRANSKG